MLKSENLPKLSEFKLLSSVLRVGNLSLAYQTKCNMQNGEQLFSNLVQGFSRQTYFFSTITITILYKQHLNANHCFLAIHQWRLQQQLLASRFHNSSKLAKTVLQPNHEPYQLFSKRTKSYIQHNCTSSDETFHSKPHHFARKHKCKQWRVACTPVFEVNDLLETADDLCHQLFRKSPDWPWWGLAQVSHFFYGRGDPQRSGTRLPEARSIIIALLHRSELRTPQVTQNGQDVGIGKHSWNASGSGWIHSVGVVRKGLCLMLKKCWNSYQIKDSFFRSYFTKK